MLMIWPNWQTVFPRQVPFMSYSRGGSGNPCDSVFTVLCLHHFWAYGKTEMSQMDATVILDKWSESSKDIAQIKTPM